MADDCRDTEEHEMPSVEAVLACTLALMTGYSQALQAELHPRQRLAMGETIGSHLAGLVDHPLLSSGFRQVLLGLQSRWRAMSACTLHAARECAEPSCRSARSTDDAVERRPQAPERLH